MLINVRLYSYITTINEFLNEELKLTENQIIDDVILYIIKR